MLQFVVYERVDGQEAPKLPIRFRGLIFVEKYLGDLDPRP